MTLDGFSAVRQHELGRPELSTKDAVDRRVHQRSSPPPRPNGGRGRWEDVRDQRRAHHPVPSPTDRRHGQDPDRTRVGQEAPYRVPRPGTKAIGQL